MNKTSVIKKLKVLFGMELQFAEAKLKDGTIVSYEELIEGKELYLVTEEGNVLATPGDYTLEDETVVTVDDNGIITLIKVLEAAANAEVSTIDEPRIVAIEDSLVALFTKVDEIMAKFETPLESEMYSEMKEELNSQKEELNSQKELIEKLSKEPAAEPAMFQQREEKPLTSADLRLAALRELQK